MKHITNLFKKHVPIWKWILIFLLIISLPFFFSYYRNIQIQQAADQISMDEGVTQ